MSRDNTPLRPQNLHPHHHAAQESARRALFSAASRVLSYHAAALDRKVDRGNLASGDVSAAMHKPPHA